MKELKDFESELSRCSKCSLCESVCPLYGLSKNECAVSRGKLIMLHGVARGDLQLSKNIDKYIDMCLKCGKCSSFCPGGIDVCRILNTAKYEYTRSKKFPPITKFLYYRPFFNFILMMLSFISEPFRPRRYICKEPKLKVLYFKGCVNKVFPQTDKFINKIFSNTDIQVLEPNFDCCGLPFLSEGDLTRFEQAAQYNIKKFETDYDFIVTDCASCEDTILNYPKYIEKISIQPGKTINWGDLIVYKKLRFEFTKPVRITFHKPCHLKSDAFWEKIVNSCTNVEYVKMNNYDDCCGFAGSFVLKNPSMSRQLMEKKARHIIESKVDYVITSCPSCILGLKCGLKLLGNNKIKVLSLLEFLSGAQKILN